MKCRLPDPGSVPIPADVAAGPDVRIWGRSPELQELKRIASSGDEAGDRARASQSVMLVPWFRWQAARAAWARTAGVSYEEAHRLVPIRGPFMGERPAV